MTSQWIIFACLILALWSAVIGGVFSAFSEFVMRGLLRAAPAGGIESMQHINRTVLGTQFVAGILLIGPLSLAMATYAVMSLSGAAVISLVSAAVVFVPSVLLMTTFGNVPMNNRLAGLDHRSAEAETYWCEYGRKWTRLNHVRAVGSIATAALFLAAAFSLAGGGQA